MRLRRAVGLSILAAAVASAGCGGGEDGAAVTPTTSEPTWCRTLDEFREEWIALDDAWVADELTAAERDAAHVEMAAEVRDGLPATLREPFEDVYLGELDGTDLADAMSTLFEHEQSSCTRRDADAEVAPTTLPDLDGLTDLEKYCAIFPIEFDDYPGGRKQLYEDLVRYAPSEVRAHERLVLGHLAGVVGEDVHFEDVDGDANAVAPGNLMDSIDAIDRFREERC